MLPLQIVRTKFVKQGLKKVLVLSSRTSNFSFLLGLQETFHFCLHDGQGPRQVIWQISKKIITYDLPCASKIASCLSKGQTGIQDFFSPA